MSSFEFPVNLPDVTFADADPAAILARLIADYEREADKTLYPGDPERLILNTAAYTLSVAYGLLDYTGRQNLLAHAEGGFLDHIASFHGVTRLPSSSATCMQRFFAEPGLDFAVAIPAGLRVTPDNGLFFLVTESTEIPAATEDNPRPYVDVTVECQGNGSEGNGFLAGQIRTLVDPQPYVASTANVSISEGGADDESDEHLRQRVYVAPEAYSTAGPQGSYESLVLGVSQLITDVAVLSPEPCFIEIYPLLKDGAVPGDALLQAISDTLSPRDVRPQGDRVSVHAPEMVEFDVVARYFVRNSDKANIAAIQRAVAAAGQDFIGWQSRKLGRDIVPEELTRRIMAAGAKRVDIESPVFTIVEDKAVALAASVSIEFGGYEDA